MASASLMMASASLIMASACGARPRSSALVVVVGGARPRSSAPARRYTSQCTVVYLSKEGESVCVSRRRGDSASGKSTSSSTRQCTIDGVIRGNDTCEVAGAEGDRRLGIPGEDLRGRCLPLLLSEGLCVLACVCVCARVRACVGDSCVYVAIISARNQTSGI